MTKIASDLIYDIGLHKGEDTENYLSRGYRVVAIDANPALIDAARSRFAREVQDNRLTLLNIGIADANGTATFWISDRPEWSSFHREISSRESTGHTPVTVSTMPLTEIVARYGTPHYMKVDIEGNDKHCLKALRGNELPKFVSVEDQGVSDDEGTSDRPAPDILRLLSEVGYRKFKLVDQRQRWRSVRPSAAGAMMARAFDSAAYGRLRVRGLSAIAARFTDYGRMERLGLNLASGSSGPWGEDVPGVWMPFEKARAAYHRERQSFTSGNRPLYEFWYDWHATY